MKSSSNWKISSRTLGLCTTLRILRVLLLTWMCSPLLGKKFTLLKEEAGDYLVEQGMAIPRLPHWGKNNDPEQWWNINNFKILCTSYWHEVEGFLKTVSPYFPRGPKLDDDFPELHTLTRVIGQNTSVSELPAP